MPPILGYLNCSFIYPVGDDDETLPDEVIEYHDEIERAIESLCNCAGVTAGISHADIHVRDDGEYFADYLLLDVFDLGLMDELESRMINAVREIGIKFGHEFYMQKHILNGHEQRSVFVRRIYPSRNTNWRRLTQHELDNL